ncbi:MAG: EF-hand domain-containing protein [Methylicorpusculum sp.]|uniref:EF-hand domain-containing protein n=1 Tax=Methylicorpusculum sp. TaxID=2713644 RepID=UPI002724D3E9|nr:EF-hand domain-containing protein [Methylicorpusculum sp.]MDO8937681.1 EF-hand domain-containing protein [Methylicorpusculum sp.]MDO9240185.1 EF-hand domain-containing protein [Methylicorpusculum sp.]MDP2204358.1 EF-hand domain-containing protein [Methylicorpusculum sp.]
MKNKNTTRTTPYKSMQLSRIIPVAVVIGIGLAIVINPASAGKSTSNSLHSQSNPAENAGDGKGKLPTFAEADTNGDHFVTKRELQNFPYLLQTFDKVDAGNDGKLEQHEYQNLEMETKREGEVK